MKKLHFPFFVYVQLIALILKPTSYALLFYLNELLAILHLEQSSWG